MVMELIKLLDLDDESKFDILRDINKKKDKGLSEEVEKKVREIIRQVRQKGDEGLLEWTHRLDKNNLLKSDLAVTRDEFERAANQVEPELFAIIKEAIERIKVFHQSQLEKSWFSHREEGMILGQLIRPLERVGIYVPGGRAEYPSSLIMGALPALVAGVGEIIVVTPLGSRKEISPYLLMSARALGISRIYKVGGAQAVAALAYGTETIPKVDKIAGPGNRYVTMAKKQVFGEVDIDMLAGPSEILIWAEEDAEADYIAADLFSQAEHDPEARAILVTTSRKLGLEVQKMIQNRVQQFTRSRIISISLRENGKIFIAKNKQLAIELINKMAPEHLELHIPDPWAYLSEIKNFGAVFLGPYSPEPLGDYWAGPNHILPTMGSARQFSVLSVSDFVKRSSVIYCRRDKLLQDREKIARFADLEGLSAHADALRIRK